jgi:predicted helicase
VVLDPAVGTGTYPLAVIDHAAGTASRQYGAAAAAGRLESLAERLHAFEILVGPYSVAHVRISQRLHDATKRAQEVKVFLADTLDSPFQPPEFQAGLLQQRLSDEHERAQEVKRDVRVLVCLGNPPYDREEHDADERVLKRKGGWVRYGDDDDDEKPILEDFLKPVRDAGNGVHLKNL